jgi:hypothetical protein
MQANGFTFTSSETSSPEPARLQLETPYLAWASGQPDGTCDLALTYDGEPVSDFKSLRLVDIMGKPSVYYFAFKDADLGRQMPTYLVLNPYENCAYRCRYCSRLPYFARNGHDYAPNIKRTIAEVQQRIVSPQDVRFINVITGSASTPEGDLNLCRQIVEAFDGAGFGHCEYGFYTANLHTQAELEALRALRVTVLTVTVEVTSLEARLRLHEPGNPKRVFSFEDTLRLIKQAEEIFPYVNTTLMLGYESADTLKCNLDKLARETHTTINHYIPRIWLKSQLDLLHPDAHSLEYYVDLIAFIERNINAGRATIGSFFDKRFGIPQFQLRYRS